MSNVMDKQQDKVSFDKLSGPWEVSSLSGRIAIATAHSGRRMVVFPLDGLLQSCNDKGVLEPITGDEPHIRKMVAAPCMYEALVDAEKAFRKTLGMIDDWPDEYATIKAALSKANPNSNLTPSELRDKLDAVEVIGVVS